MYTTHLSFVSRVLCRLVAVSRGLFSLNSYVKETIVAHGEQPRLVSTPTTLNVSTISLYAPIIRPGQSSYASDGTIAIPRVPLKLEGKPQNGPSHAAPDSLSASLRFASAMASWNITAVSQSGQIHAGEV
jgi:hypothetical protein